nr:MAG TPA: hypothetical protein [Bacteriophage sp.]
MNSLIITLPHTPRCLSPNAKTPLTQRGGPGGGSYARTVGSKTPSGTVTGGGSGGFRGSV